MIIETENEVRLRCDRCGSQMILGATVLQASVRRRPSGWMAEEAGRHTCPLCSRATMETFRASARRGNAT